MIPFILTITITINIVLFVFWLYEKLKTSDFVRNRRMKKLQKARRKRNKQSIERHKFKKRK